MKISQVSDTVTIIELSAQEVTKYCISFEESDYNSPTARRSLWEMISDAEKISGKNLQISTSLEIDFMPDIKGGCLVIINESAQDMENETFKKGERLYTCENIDCVMDFSKALLKFRDNIRCDLFDCDGFYCLLFEYGDSTADLLAAEYCFGITDNLTAIERVREMGRCLISDRALEVLGGTFSEQ